MLRLMHCGVYTFLSLLSSKMYFLYFSRTFGKITINGENWQIDWMNVKSAQWRKPFKISQNSAFNSLKNFVTVVKLIQKCTTIHFFCGLGGLQTFIFSSMSWVYCFKHQNINEVNTHVNLILAVWSVCLNLSVYVYVCVPLTPLLLSKA